MSKRSLSVLAILTLSGCATPAADSAPFDEEDEEEVSVGSAEEEDGAPFDGADGEAEENVGSAQDAVTGTSCSGMTQDAKAVLTKINEVRTKMGMHALNCNDALQKSASKHAKYQGIHKKSGHKEEPGKEGFTGIHSWERMKNAGYNGPVMGEGICGGCDGPTAFNTWMNSVYHRDNLVSFFVKSYGYGSYKVNQVPRYATINYANDGSPPSPTARAVWPAAGETDIPTTFTCSTEIPTPCLPGDTVVGYPISLTGGSDLTVSSTKILEAGKKAIPHRVLKSSNNVKIPKSQVYMLPNDELKPATSYTVKVNGSLDKTVFEKTWSFKTRPQ